MDGNHYSLIYAGNQASSSGPKAKKYFVVSQDNDLRAILASKPGIPLLYLNQVTLVLEPPSQQSQEFNKQVKFVVSSQLWFNVL